MNTTTTQITCPGGCGGKCNGERVAASGFNSPKAKTVRVAPCSVLIAQGWNGNVQMAVAKANAAYLLDA